MKPLVIPDEVEEFRDTRWRRDETCRVETAAAAERFIEDVGFAFCLTDARRPGPSLYVAVCVLSLAAALVTIVPSVMTKQLGYHSNFGDSLRLALLASALATIGGALGGALESDAAVREATYAYRRDPS